MMVGCRARVEAFAKREELLMSKRETPLTRWFWRQTGGTLIEEFVAVRKANGCGVRLIDGVIIKSGENRIAKQDGVSIEGRDIIVVQAKAARLGMSLMGQTIFTAELMRRFKPRNIEAVALCTADDTVLRPLLEAHPGCRVVVAPTG